MQDIEDKSAEDELKEITKEIESMAPTEEESNSVSSKSSENASISSRDKHDNGKKTQPKPQKERPPRFERTVKRKNTNDDSSKKDLSIGDDKKDSIMVSIT